MELVKFQLHPLSHLVVFILQHSVLNLMIDLVNLLKI
ncbi:unnamed protein product [Schistosoma curassoni]|uniref:Uncharacterized protein n=1 Tax=Schistosoma curassoni TaxID=6186 RepID=A0A183JQM8_9TREM|nr:unnamed protein product [Schistosoma curassoni]